MLGRAMICLQAIIALIAHVTAPQPQVEACRVKAAVWWQIPVQRPDSPLNPIDRYGRLRGEKIA